MDVFAQRLKKCREDLKKTNPNYTQAFVANKIGVARTTYTAYENGTKIPPLDTVIIIADFFGVSSDYLLGRTNIKNQGELAAHRSDNFLEDLPEEAVKELETFKEFIRSKYGNKE
ncbi:helix-turn-helix domain-containing protein [Lysinibacillus boronitolerans]|uniref:HTH cro/C1-type domain-containing protein n=1 Tax=Lysinibacillus boronitolerans JCM 21713 = 10a = NBRC 103108 TaxID=1294264 RepID=A0ABR4Y4S2_9BACI|nr:helix-turn-helix transcriptional regulator [Lysinibacillus boronitolerans]KGR88835.1 hypothetical protein CD31_02285 [Lysinibacillus boronitolerans JCM 21713 = 10a = NBRC 103108]